MKWLDRLLGREEKPQIQIEPDPDMAPGEWEWSCYDCPAGGIGEAQKMRLDSMTHCLFAGHSVRGEYRNGE